MRKMLSMRGDQEAKKEARLTVGDLEEGRIIVACGSSDSSATRVVPSFVQ
jgi:hypothetical protein